MGRLLEQGIIGHELTHGSSVATHEQSRRKTKLGREYEEKRAYAVSDEIIRLMTRGKISTTEEAKSLSPGQQRQLTKHLRGTMMISKKLPVPSPDINSGVRYKDTEIFLKGPVMHPGARAFYILRDTKKHIVSNLDTIVDVALTMTEFDNQ